MIKRGVIIYSVGQKKTWSKVARVAGLITQPLNTFFWPAEYSKLEFQWETHVENDRHVSHPLQDSVPYAD